ncbi:collagen alpha-1(VIII) chain-like [Sardina pilchardus]|uniref:collagen alpha-1(VIII) chain-like n=1 Tax=Sardina pilchardus TaxID=27697 RepID=UPI002E0F2DFC
MKTPRAAVLLLLWVGLVVAAEEEACQPDLSTVVSEIRGLVAEQKVELAYTKTQLEAMETRLRASEMTVEEQREQLKQLKSVNEDQAVNINLTGSQVEKLWRERDERTVAFSASMRTSGGAYTGPISVPTTLVFKHVVTNIGNGYNPNTGVFTARVRGAYHFVLFIHGHASKAIAAHLYRNAEIIVSPYSYTSGSTTPSNGASLLLEVGDVVYVKLWANARLYDNSAHHTSFSGHLLFPM